MNGTLDGRIAPAVENFVVRPEKQRRASFPEARRQL